MMKSLNEVKNESASDRLFDHNGEERPQYNEYDFKAGWEACEAELIKRAEGRKFWIVDVDFDLGYSKTEVAEFPHKDTIRGSINVIEMTGYNALQVKYSQLEEKYNELKFRMDGLEK